MPRTSLLIAITLLPTPAGAQALLQDMARPNTILVSASGKVETAPDLATMTLSIRGEGKTPDAATTALATRQSAVIAGLRALDPRLEVRTGDIAFRELRGGDCGTAAGSDAMLLADRIDAAADTLDRIADGGKPDAKGPCRVIGHQATIETTIRLASVKDAGTAAGLAGRLGAAEARVESFTLRDDSAASRRALEQAVANARTQAAALAAASGAKLGPVLSIMNGEANAANRAMAMEVAAPEVMALAPPPVIVDITPAPVETRAQIVVAFALLP